MCQIGLIFIQKEADVEKEKNENIFLKQYSEQMDTEIARLEQAWKEEEVRRNDKAQPKS